MDRTVCDTPQEGNIASNLNTHNEEVVVAVHLTPTELQILKPQNDLEPDTDLNEAIPQIYEAASNEPPSARPFGKKIRNKKEKVQKKDGLPPIIQNPERPDDTPSLNESTGFDEGDTKPAVRNERRHTLDDLVNETFLNQTYGGEDFKLSENLPEKVVFSKLDYAVLCEMIRNYLLSEKYPQRSWPYPKMSKNKKNELRTKTKQYELNAAGRLMYRKITKSGEYSTCKSKVL